MNIIPLRVFPKKLEHIIESLENKLGFPAEYTAVSMLAAVATSVGKTIKLEVKHSWVESPVIFLCLVGRPGANKSHPLTWTLRPLLDATNDNILGKISAEDMFTPESIWSSEINDAPKTTGQYVLSNSTMEATFQVMAAENTRLIIYCDELAGFTKNMARYSKGSDVEYFLSLFSGSDIFITRKTQPPVVIPNPFCCIAGTMQPDVLKKLFKSSDDNGFMDRFLMCIPDNNAKIKMSKEDLDREIVKDYSEIIKKLLNLKMIDGEPTIIRLTEAAYEEAMLWYNENADMINDEPDDKIRGIFTKLDTYFFRLALIMQLMRWACGEAEKEVVDLESVKRAKDLIEYFRYMGKKALRISTPDPVEGMTELQRKVYINCTEEFTTSDGVRYAAEKGMSERAFKYFLNHPMLFKRLKVGRYKKLF